MKSMTVLLCCALVASVANAQSTASSASQPEQSQVLAAPGPTANDVQVADFFVACASANLDESTDKQILSLSDKNAFKSTDKNTNMQLSRYYFFFLSAVAYSNNEYAKSRFIAMRNATKEHVQGKISNGKDLLTILKEELNYDESQNALCTFYTGKYNAKITLHVKESGVLNGGSTKPN